MPFLQLFDRIGDFTETMSDKTSKIIIIYYRHMVHIIEAIIQHKSKKMVSHTVAHYRIGVCTQPTLIGAKHFNTTPTVASFTHHKCKDPVV